MLCLGPMRRESCTTVNAKGLDLNEQRQLIFALNSETLRCPHR